MTKALARKTEITMIVKLHQDVTTITVGRVVYIKSYFKAPCIQTSCGVFFFRIKTTSKTYPESKGGLNLKGELAHSYCRKCLSSFLYKYSLAEFVLKMQKNPAKQNCQGKRKTALDAVES